MSVARLKVTPNLSKSSKVQQKIKKFIHGESGLIQVFGKDTIYQYINTDHRIIKMVNRSSKYACLLCFDQPDYFYYLIDMMH